MAYKQPNINDHIYTGIRANKDQLYQIFDTNKGNDLYQIVHFSVHGLFFDDKPGLNSLALTNREVAEKYLKKTLEEYEQNHKPYIIIIFALID